MEPSVQFNVDVHSHSYFYKLPRLPALAFVQILMLDSSDYLHCWHHARPKVICIKPPVCQPAVLRHAMQCNAETKKKRITSSAGMLLIHRPACLPSFSCAYCPTPKAYLEVPFIQSDGRPFLKNWRLLSLGEDSRKVLKKIKYLMQSMQWILARSSMHGQHFHVPDYGDGSR